MGTTWVAQDSFVGETPEGAWVPVQKGQPFPASHPFVRLDRDSAEAAAKAGISRTALFAPMDMGDEDEPEPAPPKAAPKPPPPAPPKPATGRKGS